MSDEYDIKKAAAAMRFEASVNENRTSEQFITMYDKWAKDFDQVSPAIVNVHIGEGFN